MIVTVHVAEGFVDAMDNYGVIGTWPLRPICGAKPDSTSYGPGEKFYAGHESLAPDWAQPCTECFSHPDMPLILLGAM